jgi:HKD family nuclease
MTRSAEAKLDLHDALSRGSFDHAVLCTFTFDPSFFEQHCLEKFKSLHSNSNITVMVDRAIYEDLLVEESDRPKKANLRYLLQPVGATGNFHPKIFFLARHDRARLIIGSANLTRNGITSNAEMAASFEYEEGKNEMFKPLFKEAFSYISEIAKRFPTTTVYQNLNAIVRDLPWLVSDDESSIATPAFVHNLVEPIWPQLCRDIAGPVDTIYVLSRYFDADPSLLDEVDKTLSPKKVKIFSQNGITNLTSEWLSHPMAKANRAQILMCRFSDADRAQPLHAKAIVIERRSKCLLAFGSANFTTPGLLRTINNGNAEAVLVIRGISSRTLKPSSLFDPNGTGVLLTAPQMLLREPAEPKCIASHTIQLHEAWLEDDVIKITADIPSEIDSDLLFVNFSFQYFVARLMKLQGERMSNYFVKVSTVEKDRLNSESTLIQLQAVDGDEVFASSNVLLVTNLKEVKTDRSLRRERYVREAEQSAMQFFAVLRELLEMNDEEALRSFLELCDIPLIGLARPFLGRRMKPIWDGGQGMRVLGSRNLEVYKKLHELTLNFFDRHFRKLRKHTNARTVEGVANFLHIFLAMGQILHSQIERSVIGLEAIGAATTAEQWADCRKHWDTYFDRFKQLMDCLGTEYLAPMLKQHGLNKVKEEIGPDLEPIHILCTDILGYRDRIELFRTTKWKGLHKAPVDKAPGYFYSVLGEEQWSRYLKAVRGVLEKIENTFGYAA